MPSRTFRFVQAADFRLEQVPQGLADAADHLTEPLVESAYRAALAVFDLALAEEVDFVVLTGHLVEPELAGPRGPTFLAEQFSRLAVRGIRVYWTAAPADARRNWPITLAWPDNVHVFDSRRIERVVHERAGEPICVLIARSIDEVRDEHAALLEGRLLEGSEVVTRLGELHALRDALAIDASAMAETIPASALPHTFETVGADPGLFRIAIAPLRYSTAELETVLNELPTSAPPCYLAYSGASSATTPVLRKQPIRVAHSSGTTQGQSILETGARGTTLVEVDPASAVRIVARATDAVRWHDERITLAAGALRAELDRRLKERMDAILAAAPDRTLLVRWTIDGASSLVSHARQTGLAAELLTMLRTEYGRRSPPVWTTAVTFESHLGLPESWYEQQTLLGEYLRTIRSLEESGANDLDLHRYVPEAARSGPLGASLSLADPAQRTVALREAARLGADLLRPGEIQH